MSDITRAVANATPEQLADAGITAAAGTVTVSADPLGNVTVTPEQRMHAAQCELAAALEIVVSWFAGDWSVSTGADACRHLARANELLGRTSGFHHAVPAERLVADRKPEPDEPWRSTQPPGA